MGALDRIVAAGDSAEEKGRGAGAEHAADAPEKGPAEPAEASATDHLAGEQAGPPPGQGPQRDDGFRQQADDEPPAKARDGGRERAARGERGLDDEAVEPRARLSERRDAARPLETQQRDAKGAMARVADDAPEPKAIAPAAPVLRKSTEPTRPAPAGPIEVRREQVVRERVVERTLVDRLVVPQRPVRATEQPASPLPSIIRAPERKESAPKEPTPARDIRGGEERTGPQASVPPRPRPAAHDAIERERGELRRQERPPQAPQKDAAREIVAPPAPATRNAEAAALGLRNERRERLDDSKGQTPRAAPSRAVANMLAPRPAKVPAAPTRAPAAAAAPRRDHGAHERPERPAPRPAPAPRIQISIGRVEVKSKPAEPTLQRGPVTGPRSHQIDPGLGFGPLDGGRV